MVSGPSKPKVTGAKPRWPTLTGYIWSRWQSEKRRFLEYRAEVFGDKNGDASHVTSFVGGLTLARNLKLEEYGLNPCPEPRLGFDSMIPKDHNNCV